MLESLTIKCTASYNDEGIEIKDLKKVNFIYGANGCGKTTISNFLYNPADEKFEKCGSTWKATQPLNALVYNKEFRERNFGNGKLDGVFTLGEATTEEIKTIDEKTELLKNIKSDGLAKREALKKQLEKKEQIVKDFIEFSWRNIYKKFDSEFKEAFVGSMRSGELFKTRLIHEFENNTSDLQSISVLREKAKTIFGEIPQLLETINNIQFQRVSEIETNPIWKKIVVGKADVDIARLIQKLNINDWVNQGREYLLDDQICPFCQQKTIDDSFKEQLENYFDETYVADITAIKELRQEYSTLFQNILHQLNNIEISQKEFKWSKLDNDKFSAYLKTLISQHAANSELLLNKEKEPSRSLDLVSTQEQYKLIEDLISNANSEIEKHNKIVANYNGERAILISSIWKFLCVEFQIDIEKFNKEKLGLELGISSIQEQLDKKLKEFKILESEITELSKNLTSVLPTINEINRLLKSYGFLNFQIVPATEEGFYQIHREDGTIAEHTLSEGEITFITFLYFLQLAKGGLSKEKVNDERILVIDDPISSLDSSVLFVVSTLIKELIKKVKTDTGFIKQIILLTHNVYFHKEVSYEGLNRKGEKSQFWILRKNQKHSTIHPYGENNPIQSSYELLWREIKEWEKNSGMTIQNTMRRILETYFNILGNKRDDILINKFGSQEEKEICRSLLSWANEGSHTLPDDLFIEAPDGTISKYLEVFKNIFIYTDNAGHYQMMIGENLD